MFDDTKNNTSGGSINQGAPKPSDSQPDAEVSPSVLHTQNKEKEEEFSPETPQPTTSSKPISSEEVETEDIFAETDKSAEVTPAKPAVFQPKTAPSSKATTEEEKTEKAKTEVMSEQAPVGAESHPTGQALLDTKNYPTGQAQPPVLRRAGQAKKIIFFMAAVVILGLVGYGAFWGYQNYFKDFFTQPETRVEDSAKEQPAEDSSKDNIPEIVPKTSQTGQEDITSPIKPIDTDQDGLTDEEERSFGTNVNSTDTDDDGLFDREEVRVYKTDPLNSDTDGDGYLDGDEVKGGYNPLGPGMLYEL